MDFTLKIFQNLLQTFLKNGCNFITFQQYINSSTATASKHSNNSTLQHFNNSTTKPLNFSASKQIILRHDVDRLPQNALQTAITEYELGIKGTYYFRIVSESYDLNVMKKIAELGHEIGYHYEDVDLVYKKLRNNGKNIEIDELRDLAYESFCENLKKLRENFDIKTICMHGSPKSKYDNKLIWEKYNYRDLGLIGEPYFDIDYNEFAYFTDTGRRWNGVNVSIRDKVNSKYKFNFRSTYQIIKNIDKLPSKILLTIHPERWNDKFYLWSKELVWQNTKNIVKWLLVRDQRRN